MEDKKLKEILGKHKKWLNGEEGGERANLTRADLRVANLTEADLDFACWPLWCGSKGVKVDDRIMAQLINHVLALDHPLAKKLRKIKTVTSLCDKHEESRKMWV